MSKDIDYVLMDFKRVEVPQMLDMTPFGYADGKAKRRQRRERERQKRRSN